MNIVKKIVIVALTLITMIDSQLSSAAEVRSISREVIVEGASEPTWLVSVSCAEVALERQIERIGKSGKWCSKELSSMCYYKKVKVAKKVCGTHFERQLAEYRKANAGSKTQLVDSSVDQNVTQLSTTQGLSEAVGNQSDLDSLLVKTDSDVQSTELSKELLEIRQRQVILEQRKLELKLKEIKLREQADNNS